MIIFFAVAGKFEMVRAFRYECSSTIKENTIYIAFLLKKFWNFYKILIFCKQYQIDTVGAIGSENVCFEFFGQQILRFEYTLSGASPGSMPAINFGPLQCLNISVTNAIARKLDTLVL